MRNWSEASLQSMFNHVSRHLLKQGARAMEGDTCVCYDKATGRRCAVGCLLPKKYYKHDMFDIDVLFKVGFLNKRKTDHYDLMVELQMCHDFVKPSRWASRLRAIAREHKLEIPEFLQKVK